MASFAATPAPFVIHTASNNSCSKVDLSCRSDKLMYDHMHLKVVAIAAIILASLIGVVLPLVTKNLERSSNVYFVGRSFAAGIILATGFVHMLPQNVFDSFTNPCLPVHSWAKFSFAGCVAMVAMVFTLVADASASAFYLNKQASWAGLTGSLELEFEGSLPLANRPRLHIQYPHHEHTSYSPAIIRSTAEVESSRAQIIRLQRSVIAQKVVEIGTIAHSVIIGMLLGASQSPCTIRPLLAALCFHQMFQGLALGGCIAKAGFRNLSAAVIMAFFFCITTPGGIAIGIGIASVYNQKCSPRTLIIAEGLFDSMSAPGILVYMALVDLVAHEFLSEDLAKQPLRQVVEYLIFL